MTKLMAVDLFAGGGGLSVGLRRAGFRVVAAVELEKSAADTYSANLKRIPVIIDDIRNVTGAQLKKFSPTGKIDLISGCPPCQGFTSLTAKYEKDDPRNALIGEMLRIIKEVRPTAVMMENVPGLETRGRYRFSRFLNGLRKLGYLPEWKTLQVADYGVPQFRRRLVVLAGRGFKISMPDPTHSFDGKGLPAWKTVREAIGGMPKPISFGIVRRKKLPIDTTEWHVVREISDDNQARLRAARAGKSWWSIPSHLRPDCHKGEYRGFGNVYGRMKWNEVSPTITGGCTTLSKGRFGHPQALRTISVREAALLQTFPRDFIFRTEQMDQACEMIGNALPCDFAEALSRHCLKLISKHRAA